MTDFDPAIVAPNEHGLIRVFLVGRPPDLKVGERLPLARICEALGVDRLNEQDIQQIWNTEIEDLSFTDFLRKGYEVNEDDVARENFALDAMDEVKALILVIRSSAFVERPATITLEGPLMNHVATLREPDASVVFRPLPDAGAKGPVEDPPQKKRPSDAAMSGRIATLALLVMGLLVWLMIWVAG